MMAKNPNNFADYLWMGDEMDNFDEQMEAKFEEEIKEEEFIKSCIEQLLDEEEEQTVYFNPSKSSDGSDVPNEVLFDPQLHYHSSNQQVPNYGMNMVSLNQQMQSMFIPPTQPQQHQNGYHHTEDVAHSLPISNEYHPENSVNILSKVSLSISIFSTLLKMA